MSGVITYKCPNCGGPVKYDPEKRKYACEYCLSEFTTLKDIEPEEKQPEHAHGHLKESQGEKAASGEPYLYNCPSCGAEIVTDGTTAATLCYYCHNPVILSGRLSGQYHPDYVVPFDIEKEKAEEIFQSWMKKKRFLPRGFYSEEQMGKLTGVYFPYLLYSCRVHGTMDAVGERIRIWTSGDHRYTETKTYSVRRSGIMPVKFVPRNALKKANRNLVEGVLPYDTQSMKPFSMTYLSGFMAERRDMEKEEFSDGMVSEMRSFAQDSLRSSITSYQAVRVQDTQVQMEDETWEYALLPVWTLTYHQRAKDKVYYFTINGQSGKVCGMLPVDGKKMAALFAGVFFPVFFVLMIVGYFI